MSKFSERLKLHIEQSGLKVYQIAKNSDLDRTTIQRTITGKRLPSLGFVDKLSDYLRLSPIERSELIELYSISKIGEAVYAGRKYTKELIERIATIHIAPQNASNAQKSFSFTSEIGNDNEVFSGQYIVNNMVRYVLEYEVANNPSPEINVYVPFSYNFLFDLLYQLYLREKGKITIRNIIKLMKNPHAFKNPNYNLEALSHVMPFAFAAGNGYQPYYYYDNFDASNDIALLMPYYIITGKYLITISADFKTAILYSNDRVVGTYKEIFKRAVTLSKPLIAQHFSCEDLLITYIDSYKNFGSVSHIIEPQPCFAWYYTDDLIRTHLRQDVENRGTILDLLHTFYYKCRPPIRPMSIFSIEGMSYFVSTGILSDLPTQFAIPFTIEERIMLLEKLRNDMDKDLYRAFVANPIKFVIPFSTIQLYNTKGLDFFEVDNNGAISSSYIEEKSICEAFYDFLESLPGSNLVYGKEESIEIIDSFIEQLSDSRLLI